MCMSSPSVPAPPPPPPPPPAAPMTPDAPIVAAGKGARDRANKAMGPMSTIINIGGPAGLTEAASTSQKSTFG